MPLTYSYDTRVDLANRINSGQSIKDAATALSMSLKTAYRLRKVMDLVDDSYVPRQLDRTIKQRIDREALVALSTIRLENPKLTLVEVQQKAIDDGVFEDESAPDISTIWRRLQKLGHRYSKPIYQDDRAKRSLRQWEACHFRKAQDEGLDPTTLLSFDESFIASC